MKQNKVPLVMAMDNAYSMPAAVTILSLMENSSREYEYSFSFLVPEEDEDILQNAIFRALADRYENLSYQFIKVPSAAFRGHEYILRNPLGPMTYARLLIPELLNNEDTCLYLDGDLLVRRDVSELYYGVINNCRFHDNYLAACADSPMQMGKGHFFDEHRRILGTTDLTGYFQAGVLVMNLKRIREDDLKEQFARLYDNPYVQVDQDILNLTCKGHVMELPEEWNVMQYDIHTGRLRLHWDEAACKKEEDYAIIHFAGSEKPWKHIETKWEKEWYHFASLLPDCKDSANFRTRLDKVITEQGTDTGREIPEYRLADTTQCVIYGFTEISKAFYDVLVKESRCNPICFCDHDPLKCGLEYRGCRCVEPEAALAMIRGSNERAYEVIICAQNRWREIYEKLTERYDFPRERILRFRLRDSRLVSCKTGVEVN